MLNFGGVTESAIRIPINQLYEAEQPIKDPYNPSKTK